MIGQVHNLEQGELLEELSDESASLIVLDPPTYRTTSGTRAELEYSSDAVVRILKPGGAVVALGDAKGTAGWEWITEYAGLDLVNEMVVLWSGAPRLSSQFTNIRWHMKPGRRTPAHKGPRVKSNVIVCEPVPMAQRLCPSERPVELFNYLITLLTRRGDLVGDPFMGSGAALVAAELTGRKWVGADIDPDLCRAAELRIENYETETLRPLGLWHRGRVQKVEG